MRIIGANRHGATHYVLINGTMDRFSGRTAEGRERVIAQEPIGRMGRPEEIAAAVIWLCSNASAFVIGHAMVIDGGADRLAGSGWTA